MEIIKIYLQDLLNVRNGITGFSVLQSLAFTYWSQSDAFKDNVKYRGHWVALGAIFLFVIFYCFALWVVTQQQVALLKNLAGPIEGQGLSHAIAVSDLVQEAWTSFFQRVVVVLVFGLVSATALLRYFAGRW